MLDRIDNAISFTVPGHPIPWARAGGGKTMHRFTPAKQRKYMAGLRLIAQAAMRDHGGPFAGPVRLEVIAIYAWPKSWSEKRRNAPGARWKVSRPDSDNLIKIVKDALQADRTGVAVAFKDDAQVAAVHCWKFFDEMPCLKIRISVLS
jgi:Holliday junction resolvase RusA-like endonuclease